MQMGAQTESVTVTADVAAIDTDRSVVNQLMDNKAVSELPLNGRQVFMLMQLSAGTVFTQQQFGASGFSGTRAWDTNGSLTMHGGTTSSNQFNLDGASINAGTGEWKFAPLVDGIEEFKVSTPSSDASLGLSGGGVVNMTMKGGTNTLHGTLSEYVRNNIFDAVATQTNQSPIKATQHQWNDFSALVGGPIKKNKLFFSSWYEGFRERVPFPVTQTVPSELERVGDFSNTRNASGAQIVIFDPFSTVAAGSGYARTAFPNNVIPASMQSPISKNLMAVLSPRQCAGKPLHRASTTTLQRPTSASTGITPGIPSSTTCGTRTSAPPPASARTGASNIAPATAFRTAPRNRATIRCDASITVPLSITSGPSTPPPSWTSAQPGSDMSTTAPRKRPTLSTDRKLGWKNPIGSSPTIHFPQLAYSGYLTMATGGYTANRIFWPDQSYTLSGSVSKTLNKHLLKFGTAVAETRPNRYTSGWTYGNYSFDGGFTRRNPQTSDTTSGNSIASFLLGAVASGNTDINAQSSAVFRTYSFFVQDDFKVTSKLTLNLGVRWDRQTPITERYDRMIVGWDPTAKYTLGSGSATGGLVFAKPGARTSWDASYTGFQPRIGLAYQLPHRIVMRGSYGMSYLPLGGTSGLVTVRQNGYSRSTPYNATVGGGLNSYIPNMPGASTWENPFPNGILQPYGNTLGVRTAVGTGVTYDAPDYTTPYVHQFNFGFEYELPWWNTVARGLLRRQPHAPHDDQQEHGRDLAG